MGLEVETPVRVAAQDPPRPAASHPALPEEETGRNRFRRVGEEEHLLLSDLPDAGPVRDASADRALDQLHLHDRASDRQAAGTLDQSRRGRYRSKAGIEKSTAATELE